MYRVDASYECTAPLVLQNTALMGKGFKTPLPAGHTNTTVINTAERQVRMHKVHHGLIDTGAASTGFSQYLIYCPLIRAVEIQRQRFGLAVDMSENSIQIGVSHELGAADQRFLPA